MNQDNKTVRLSRDYFKSAANCGRFRQGRFVYPNLEFTSCNINLHDPFFAIVHYGANHINGDLLAVEPNYFVTRRCVKWSISKTFAAIPAWRGGVDYGQSYPTKATQAVPL